MFDNSRGETRVQCADSRTHVKFQRYQLNPPKVGFHCFYPLVHIHYLQVMIKNELANISKKVLI